jgi:flagellar protein FlaI
MVYGFGTSDSRAGAKVSSIRDPLSDPRFRDLIKKKSLELDERFTPFEDISEKLVIQEEMTYMRKQRQKGLLNLNIIYPVNPPYSFINILFNKEESELEYLIKEPKLSNEELELLDKIRSKMEMAIDEKGIPIEDENLNRHSEELTDFIKKTFFDTIDLYDIKVDRKRRPILLYFLIRNLIGMGKADPIIKDPFVEDISCNGPHTPIYVYHRVFGSMKTNAIYENEINLNNFIFRLAQISGRHISVYQPILDSILPDGSRINLTLGTEVTRKGSTFSIRKYSHDPLSPVDLIRFKSIGSNILAYLWLLIEYKKSILISGGTASGKTTLLNVLCMFIRPEDKIVSIEDTPEIHIDHENWIQSVSRSGFGAGVSGLSGASGVSGLSGISGGRSGDVSMFDLLVAALRQRPEYVIVGEVRGHEAFTLFQAISVGHASMSTVHAGSIDELIHRVENEPMNVPRVLFQSLDCVIFPGIVTVGSNRARRVKEIIEVLEVERNTSNLLTNRSYYWVPREDAFKFTGRSFVLETIAKESGKEIEDIYVELKRKEKFINLMDENNITNYKEASDIINDYYLDPTSAVLKLERRS